MNRGSIGRGVLVAVLACAGCSYRTTPGGDDGGADARPSSNALPFASGGRLRARVLDGGGGAMFFQTWIDTQLGEPCAFQLASDGRYRCIPPNNHDTLVYLDAACTQLAAVHQASEPTCSTPPPRWVYDAAPGPTAACEVGRAGAIYRLSSTPVAASTAYSRYDGECRAGAIGPTFALYAVTSVAPETFVAATLSTAPRTDRLGASTLAADDGARLVLSARDTQYDRDCAPLGALSLQSDDGRCLPDVAWDVGNFFADASCTTPAAFYYDNCTPRVVVSVRGLDPCGAIGLFTVGPRAPAVSHSNAFGREACAGNPARDVYWHLGAPVAPGDFGTLDILRVGTGRLRARYYAAGGSALVKTWTMPFYDTSTGRECDARAVGDGMRCLPASVGEDIGNAFSDAGCTHAIVATYRVGVQCAPVPLEAVLRRTSPGCVPRNELVALGARYEGEVFHLEGARCVAAGDTSPEYYEPGAPLDPGAYGAVTERTE